MNLGMNFEKWVAAMLLLVMPGALLGQTPQAGPATQAASAPAAQAGTATAAPGAQAGTTAPAPTEQAGASPQAVIYATGTVYVNGAALGNSSAVMAGDVVQTKDNGAANISLTGSSVVVDSNSIVRAQPDGYSLDRGSISVATGRGLSVYARDFKITPVTSEWTQYYVTRSSGTIGIIARKNAVTVECGARTETVREGQQLSREDAASCGLVAQAKGAPAAAKGPILTTSRAEWIALGTGAALAAYGLAHDDDPVSPSKP